MQDVAAAEESGEGGVEEEPEEPSDDKQADETTEPEMANDSTGEDELGLCYILHVYIIASHRLGLHFETRTLASAWWSGS